MNMVDNSDDFDSFVGRCVFINAFRSWRSDRQYWNRVKAILK
jgi:hypothetical protein